MYIFSKYWRVLLTAVVFGFFIFFWINGPLQQFTQFLNEDIALTEYSIPKLVGQKKESLGYGTITNSKQEYHFGNGLISDQSNPKKVSALIGINKNRNNNISGYEDQFNKHISSLKLPEAEIVSENTKPLAIFHKDQSVYLETSTFLHHIRGYAGVIDLGIHLNKYGEILNVFHLKSNETESYLQKLYDKGYFDQYKNISINQKNKLDAISGATITSKAISKTITAVVVEAKHQNIKDYVDVDDVVTFSVISELNKWWIVHIVVIGLLFVFTFQKKLKKTKKSIFVLNSISVIYIGFFLNNSFTYVTFIHPFVGTNISMFVGIYALLTILGSIWGKNLYCKFVCPYGNAQRLLLKISNKKLQSPFFISTKWAKRIRDILTVVLIVGVLLGFRKWSNYELFPDFFSLEFMAGWFIISTLIVLINVKYPLIWCRMLCPTGAVLDGIHKVSTKNFKW